ncbi:MAG: FkbM family methyltransferase [Thermostichus sp. HHBFW_bins_43]
MSFLIQRLKDLGLLKDTDFSICSVGAGIYEEDDFESSWYTLGSQLTIFGFEPNPYEFQRLVENYNEQKPAYNVVYFNKAVSQRSEPVILNVASSPPCSSIYQPNDDYCERICLYATNSGKEYSFDKMSKATQVISKVQFQSTTLDEELPEATILDFLKIDVQGADLDVLIGGEKKVLPNLLALQIEIELNPLYIDQPLFGDIDSYLRKQGLSILDFRTARRLRSIAPVFDSRNQGWAGQLLWGDAIYFRDLVAYPEEHPLKTPKNLLKLACVLSCLWGNAFIDIALESLIYLATHYGDLTNRYFEIAEIAKEIFCHPDYGLGLTLAEAENTEAIQMIRSAKELAEQLS